MTERLLGAAVVVQFIMLVDKPPGEYLRPDLAGHPFLAPVFPVACVLMAILSVTLVVRRPLLGRATFPVVVALSGVAAAWMLWASPAPNIDVVDFARESARALAHGLNPYDLHFPNRYGDTKFFGPGFATPQSIDVGVVYPPLSLLLSAAGEWVAGDSRATLVVALMVTALLIDRLGGQPARLAALLFISNSRQYYVIEHGWTEPILVGAFALLLLLASRRSRGTPVALGMVIALKQFALLSLPLVPLLVGEIPSETVAAGRGWSPGVRRTPHGRLLPLGPAGLRALDPLLPPGSAVPPRQPQLRCALDQGPRWCPAAHHGSHAPLPRARHAHSSAPVPADAGRLCGGVRAGAPCHAGLVQAGPLQLLLSGDRHAPLLRGGEWPRAGPGRVWTDRRLTALRRGHLVLLCLLGAATGVLVTVRLQAVLPEVPNRHAFTYDASRRAMVDVDAADALRRGDLGQVLWDVAGPEQWPTLRLLVAAPAHVLAGPAERSRWSSASRSPRWGSSSSPSCSPAALLAAAAAAMR